MTREAWKKLPVQLNGYFVLNRNRRAWTPQLQHLFETIRPPAASQDWFPEPRTVLMWRGVNIAPRPWHDYWFEEKTVVPKRSAELERLDDAWNDPDFWSIHLLQLAKGDWMDVTLMMKLAEHVARQESERVRSLAVDPSVAASLAHSLPCHLFPEFLRRDSLSMNLVLQGPDLSMLMHVFEFLPRASKQVVAQTCSFWRDVAALGGFSGTQSARDSRSVRRWYHLQSLFSRELFKKLKENERVLSDYLEAIRPTRAEPCSFKSRFLLNPPTIASIWKNSPRFRKHEPRSESHVSIRD
jgi:hypothetical protein